MPLERSVSQNNAFALRKLVELADQGAKNTLARSFKYLWTGEKSNLPKNRQKAVALLDKNPNDKHVNVLRAIAKGAGLSDGNIPLEAYKRAWNDVNYVVRDLIDSEIQAGNPEAAACKFFNDRAPLTKMLDAGNKRAAELVAFLLQGQGGEGNEQLLAKAGAKTGYDKGADDIQKLDAVYAEIDSLARGLKTGALPFMNYYLQLYQFYEKHPESDKHGYREKAKPLLNFITISEAMNVRDYEPKSFWYYNIETSGPFGMIKTDYGPQWNSRDEDFRKIDEAISLCKIKQTDKKYGKLFQSYKLKLKQKQKVLRENRQKGEVSYRQALAEYRAKEAKKSSYSSSSSNDSSDDNSADMNSCQLHLYFEDGDYIANEYIEVGYTNAWSGKSWSGEFYVGDKGHVTIKWPKEFEKLNWFVVKFSLDHLRYERKAEFENGGKYEICLNCK